MNKLLIKDYFKCKKQKYISKRCKIYFFLIINYKLIFNIDFLIVYSAYSISILCR